MPNVPPAEIVGGPPVLTDGHGGLLDIALDPAFAANHLLYLSYLGGDATASTMRVLRASFDASRLTLTGQKLIFQSTPGARNEQIGGRIAVARDGYLYLSLGDRWAGDLAQDLGDDAGKIIRIRTDGSIPGDNPFVATPGARPEIWSYGHRNPQGLALNAATGQLWSDEHGAQGGDELNLIERGRNYGWPIITYSVDYSGRPLGEGFARDGLEQPVRTWVPISIAPSGLAVEPDPTRDVVWISALAGQMLVKLDFGKGCTVSESHVLKDRLGRLRDVRIGPNGDVYTLTDGPEGTLYRLEPVPHDFEEHAKTHL
jgi:glucose/arabinose dehydrogenase